MKYQSSIFSAYERLLDTDVLVSIGTKINNSNLCTFVGENMKTPTDAMIPLTSKKVGDAIF